MKQHKFYLESVNIKDKAELRILEDKVKITKKLENQIKDLKENLTKYKDKLHKNLAS